MNKNVLILKYEITALLSLHGNSNLSTFTMLMNNVLQKCKMKYSHVNAPLKKTQNCLWNIYIRTNLKRRNLPNMHPKYYTLNMLKNLSQDT